MAKVGSTALRRSLERVNIYCRHYHWAAVETQASYAQRPRLKLIRENVGVQKNYGDLYREISGIVKFPAEFVDHLCNWPYVRHFHSDGEREAMRRKWSG